MGKVNGQRCTRARPPMSAAQVTAADRQEAVLVVRQAIEAGGRADPSRFLARSAEPTSRNAFLLAQARGWLDRHGRVTSVGGLADRMDPPDPPAVRTVLPTTGSVRPGCDCRPGMDGGGVYHEPDCASRRASRG